MAERHVSGEVLGQSPLEEMELNVSKETFIELLRNLADGLESGHEFEIELNGVDFILPQGGEMKVEIDPEERELKLKYTWRY